MRYGIAVTEAPVATAPFRPRWGLIGVIAAGSVLLIILTVIIVKVIVSTPRAPLGVTSFDELQPGSCLDEDETDLDEYTVVDCSEAHPQQVIALIDLGKTDNVYTQFSSMSSYAQQICDRFIEYRLYLREAPNYDDLEVTLLAMPTEDQFNDGLETARCAIISSEGDDLTESYYRAMP